MIHRINTKFDNKYAGSSRSKQINTCFLNSEQFIELYCDYFTMKCVKNEDLNTCLEKFKLICMMNYYIFQKNNYSKYTNYFYLINNIKKDINKYINTNKIKFLDFFYHPLNACLMFTKEDFDGKVTISSDDCNYSDEVFRCCCFTPYYYDKITEQKIDNDANILITYESNNKKYAVIIFYMSSHGSSSDYFISPRFKNVRYEDYEKYRNRVNKYITEKVPILNKFSKIKNYNEEFV